MTKKEKKRTYRTFTAMEKVQAVLSIWSERRRPSEVCREHGIKWAHLNNWQKRALEGMLGALEPKKGGENKGIPAIGGRLKKLLDRKIAQDMKNQSRLQQRLTSIQEKKEDAKKAS